MKEFRYDIGFLRVIAVSVVLFYHFKLPFFDGGFSGVDIFFVISGFLMTKIILTGIKKGKFTILDFYNRRFKRIVPPLLLTAAGILIISNALFLTNEIQQNSKNVLLSSVFISNIYYSFFTNYFDAEAQKNIFLHSWSLAVEWQFYMIYPLLLLPVRKIYLNNERLFKIGFIIFTAISFVLCLYIIGKNSSFTFYMIPTRAWEMLLGGIAFLYGNKTKTISQKFKVFIVVGAYILILLSVVLITDLTPWPSIYTVIPVFSTFIILWLNVNFTFLKWQPLQFIGDISYEIYLWHWPIYVTFMYFQLDKPLYIFYILILTIILSTFSYFFVKKTKAFDSFRFNSIFLLFIVLVSYYGFTSTDNKLNSVISVYPAEIKKMNSNVAKILNQDRIKQFNPCNCFITADPDYTEYKIANCLTIDPAKKNYVFLGDSHNAQFSSSLRENIGRSYNIIEVSAGNSIPFINPRGRAESKELFLHYYKFINENYNSIDKVFISVHWLMKNMPGLKYTDLELKDNILQMIRYYQSKNIKVYFIGQSESYDINFDKVILYNHYNPAKSKEEYISSSSRKMNLYLKSFIPANQYIDIFNLSNIRKYDSVNAMPYMSDNNHFTKFGADQIVNLIKEKGYFK